MESNGAFKGSAVLKKCELKGAEDTGRELAQGCYYARSVEVSYKGLKCLARTITPECLGPSAGAGVAAGGGSSRERSAEQLEHLMASHCARLLELRHPNIIQFIGIRYEPGQPPGCYPASLVTEQLPLTLSEVLERYGKLPDSINYSILRDVALGMVYLHTRTPTPVVHGELTAANIFLTADLSAKVADVGVSGLLLGLTPVRRKSIGQAALAHLPPEALALPSSVERSASRSAQASLSKKLDSYSYGVLMVHVLSARFPEVIARRAHSLCGVVLASSSSATPSSPPSSPPPPSSSSSPCSNGVEEMLGGVSPDHPLSSLLLQCVSQSAELRPELPQILSTVLEMMLQFPVQSVARKLEMVHSILQSPVSGGRKEDILMGGGGGGGVRGKAAPIARKDSITTLANSLEIEHLKLQIQELHVENRGLRLSLAKQREIVSARDHEMAARLMAKDQEIMVKYQELSAQEAIVAAHRDTIAAKDGTLSVLTSQMQHLQGFIASRHEPHLLNPKAQLKWRQCSHLPQAMVFAQAITIGDVVYYGSGTSTLTESDSVRYKIYRYSSSCDRWNAVSHCPVVGFGMVNSGDRLTLVGGAYESTDPASPLSLTGDVHVYDAECSRTEKAWPAMPTPRLLPTVLAYGSAVVSCGGLVLDERRDVCLSTVEVYSRQASQWCRAQPLPFPCIGMSHASVRDYFYFLGGFTDTEFDHPTTSVFFVCLPQLIQDALTHSGHSEAAIADGHSGRGGSGQTDGVGNAKKRVGEDNRPSLWQSFPDAPRYAASLTAVGECLLAIGGSDERLEHKSGALHVYSPLTGSWLRVEDIPVACFACAVPRLPGGELLLVGGMGHDEDDALKTVFRGRVSLD